MAQWQPPPELVSGPQKWTPPPELEIPNQWIAPETEPVNSNLTPLELELESQFKAKPEVKESNNLEKLYDSIFNAPEFITKPAKEFADSMMPSDDNVWKARAKGFVGGAAEGAASQLSPANILTMGRSRLPQLAAKVLGGTQLAHGLSEVAQGNTLEGVGDMGFGLLTGASGFGGKPKLNQIADDVINPSNIEATPPTAKSRLDEILAKGADNLTIEELREATRLRANLRRIAKIAPSHGPEESLFGKGGLKATEAAPVIEQPIAPEASPSLFGKNGEMKRYLEAIESGEIPKETRFADFIESTRVTERPPAVEFFGGDNRMKSLTVEELEKMLDSKFQDDASAAAAEIKRRFSKTEEPPRVNRPVDAPDETKPSAKFNAWQVDDTHPEGGFPLYDIQGGPSDKSSVSRETLEKMGIAIPETPPMNSTQQVAPTIKDFLTKSGVSETEISQLSPEAAITKMQEIRRGGQMDRKKQVPITPRTEEVRNPVESVNKLKSALTEAKDLQVQQQQINSQERAIRIGRASEVTTPGTTGYHEQLGMLKGEFPKVSIKSQLEQNDVESLMDAITNSNLKEYQKINAKGGLDKLFTGRVPQRHEIKLLGQVFGKDLEDLIYLHGGLGLPGGKLREIVNEAINTPKTVMATLDVSAPLRQGLPFVTKPEFWNSFQEMFKYYGSGKAFEAGKLALQERPKFQLGEDSGLYIAQIGKRLEGREEAFLSSWVGKIPGFGKMHQASERAYTGFLNKLRADVFDNLIDDAIELGHDPAKVGPEIAKFVNTATGRGSLGRFEKNAVELNALMFSPRLMSSRLTMLNPKYYMDATPMVRKEALKALFSAAGAGATVATLASQMGAEVSINPTSSDFGKIKIGNTRIDPYGGFQQYIVAASRALSGKTTATSGKTSDSGTGITPSRLGIILGIGNKYNPSFLENKLSPVASFIDNMFSQREFPARGLGAEIGQGPVSAEVINRVTPMIVNDLIEVYKDDPDLVPFMAPLISLGMGTQTFEPKQTSSFRLR